MKHALLFAMGVLIAGTVVAEDVPDIKPLFPDDPKGLKLPAAVPRMVDRDGNVVAIDNRYTTPAYYEVASQYIRQEMNDVAGKLQLPDETLPLTSANARYGATGYGRSLTMEILGSGSTANYVYSFSHGNKFSEVELTAEEQFCRDAGNSPLPIKQFDTTAPYQLATQWLAAVSMDVAALNRDCEVHVAVDPFWNQLSKLGDKPAKTFVPLYLVWWVPRDHHEVEAASVELFYPTHKTHRLLDLVVSDAKYNVRKPLVITNVAAIFPGTGRVTLLPKPTNEEGPGYEIPSR